MSKIRNFLNMVGKSLNPAKYNELNNTKSGTALGYFFMMVLVIFLLTCILSIPTILMMGNYIEDKMHAFNELTIDIAHDQSEPIYIPETNPIITIDTNNNYTTLEQGMILISKDATYYQLLPFSRVHVIEDSEDMLNRSEEVGHFISLVIIMMLPMIMAFAYAYFTLKFLLIAILGGVVGFIFARIARLSFDIGNLIKLSLYASTIMVLIGLLTKPFIPKLYYLDILIYMIFFVLVMIKLGEFEEVIRPEDRKGLGLQSYHTKDHNYPHPKPPRKKEKEIGLL